MANHIPQAPNLALAALRERRRLSKTELAFVVEVSTTMLSYYESGRRVPRLGRLLRFAEKMGYLPEDLEVLLFGMEAFVGPAKVPPGAAPLGRAELIEIRRQGIREMREWEAAQIAEIQTRRAEEERTAAERQVREIAALAPAQRQAALEARVPKVSWALVEALAHRSVAAAVDDPWQALDWAGLALQSAESVATSAERKRMLGYAWAFVANARRVTSDLRGADEAFSLAWRSWKAGRKAVWCPLEEWRLLDLEASLRRDQRNLQSARRLHSRALSLVPGKHRGRALLNLAKTFETEGALDRAISCLREAEGSIDSVQDPRLRLVYCLNLAGYLALTGQSVEAELLMPEARSLALELRNEVDLTRALWIQAWIDVAADRKQDALAALDQVRRDFSSRQLAYDAALVTLEEAVILLEEGELVRVRELVSETFWIFSSRQIRPEALASLKVFYEAVGASGATVTLARQVLARVRDLRRSPDSST